MCGLAGFWTSRALSADALRTRIEAMIDPIAHRGPDDSGTWTDPAGVALGFRRLAIIDLSENGHQPMQSATGRYTIIFNGEVYNHGALRRELAGRGVAFRGHSDTEVMLAAFEAWGIREALSRFIGMFALALWDGDRHRLTLARDRIGKKPLFIYSEPELVSFGSELKALHAGPSFDRRLDVNAVAAYLRYLYVPGPRSIFAAVRKLEPGHFVTISDPARALPDAEAYWTVDAARRAGLESPVTGSDEEVIDAFEALLSDAVRLRMEADVPLGAFLSGGIDSSTVVALMQAHTGQPVRTFSIGFDDARHDEARHAAAIAAHLGTRHTEMRVTARDALDVVGRLPRIYDEPMADASQVPMLLVCAMARRHVTVAVSGDGGDELFGGYNRYIAGQVALSRLERIPAPLRHLLAGGMSRLGTHSWDRIFSTLGPALPRTYRHRLPGEKILKLGRLMREESAVDRYRSLVSAWTRPEELLSPPISEYDPPSSAFQSLSRDPLLCRMLFADQSSYLVENQMTKADRASMAVSLELRVPILDHRVLEFSWRLPDSMKIRGQTGKWVLRQVLYRHVPQSLVDRPKMGFSVPLGSWLRGALRPWAEPLLTTSALERDGLLRARDIQRAWILMLAGNDEHVLGLWAVLQLQAWREEWLS